MEYMGFLMIAGLLFEAIIFTLEISQSKGGNTMFDVNNHPKQEEINDKIATILAETIRKLAKLSKEENIEARSLAEQFYDSFRLMINEYIDK